MKSKIEEFNQFQNLDDFKKLFNKRKEAGHFSVKEIPFSEFDQWSFDKNCLKHSSGKFFKIEGIRVKTNFGPLKQWDQPIMNQSEIGILGILTKIFDGIRYYLMQAKMEPGNINTLQLSPTTQATKSNFTQVHKGNLPTYLEYFIDRSKSKILIDQLQSEQGGRFLRKRNRNMIVEVKDDVEVLDNFFWLTLSDIKKLLCIDNFVNMDARSVISTIPIVKNLDNGQYPKKYLMSWYIDQKVKYELETEKIPLSELENWKINENSIYKDDRFFSIIGIKVEAGTREVTSWTQPMVKDLNIGLIGFIVKKINNIDHFLIQTKVMPGNIDIIDLSPTVSFSNYKYFMNVLKPRFFDYFIENKKSKIHYDVLQSEEGGRFYHFQNRNMIVEINENEKLDIPENYTWMSLNQMMEFMPLGMFNIEARSLIACL
ncbi:MAG: NDP-hexose 2,3-dehydratase family protein [Nitrosopumilus sp.]